MALLVRRRRSVRLDGVVAGIEVFDDALDRSTLAPGVTALEHDKESRADLARTELSTEVEAQLEQPALCIFDASFVLTAPQPLGEVELIESRR